MDRIISTVIKILFKETTRMVICEALLDSAEQSRSNPYRKNCVRIVKLFRNTITR